MTAIAGLAFDQNTVSIGNDGQSFGRVLCCDRLNPASSETIGADKTSKVSMNLPTWITVSRLLGVPVILALLVMPTPARCIGAAGVFLLAAGTDWLDGYLARRLNQITELGKFLDPLVDKLLVLAPLLALVEMGRVPAWGVFLILARELTIAGWRVSPALQAQVVPGANLWGKVKTVLQMTAVTLLLLPLSGVWIAIAQVTFWGAVGITWLSGLIYLTPLMQRPKPLG